MNINYKDYKINVYLNNPKKVILYFTFRDDFQIDLSNRDKTIITITKEDIEDYFSPYPYDKFKGKADILAFDLENILKLIKENKEFENSEFYTLGYSLAGLASIYMCYKIEGLSGFISCSGSLWYPNVIDYFKSNIMKSTIKKCYLSIEDKESRGSNGLFKNAITYTKEFSDFLKMKNIKSKFVLNRGTHFDNVNERIMDGIDFA